MKFIAMRLDKITFGNECNQTSITLVKSQGTPHFKRGDKEGKVAKETEKENSDSKEDHQDMTCPKKPRIFF